MSSSRTPPATKWALNERAALAGEVARAAERCAFWQARLAEMQGRLDALDRTMALLDDRVRPDALGVIRTQAGRYGPHGGLKRFLRDQLMRAGAEGISTVELTRRAAIGLDLSFEDQDAFLKFRKHSVAPQLREYAAEGLAEKVRESRGYHDPAVWRWKQSPALAELAQLALS